MATSPKSTTVSVYIQMVTQNQTSVSAYIDDYTNSNIGND